MKITVDARNLRGGGIGRFIREVTGPWLVRHEVDEITFLGDPAQLQPWLESLPRDTDTRVVPWSDPYYSGRAQLRLFGPVGSAIREADVRFFPHYDAPVLRMDHPSVVVVYDLTHFQPGVRFPRHKRLLGGLLLDAVVRRATRVVTVSENSRDDILARQPGLDGRVRVVRPGVSETFRGSRRNGHEHEYLWESFRPFLLTVGEPRPHKRIDFAVDLLAELHTAGRTDMKLLTVGPGGGVRCPVRVRAVERGVSAHVVSLGRVRDEVLRELYGLAEALVFPSLYEGFGLPVAEALACGCPVLASDRASIPEAGGDQAVLLDPYDVGAWKRAFLAMPERNGKPGSEQSCWRSTSDQVFDVLREAYEETRVRAGG